MAFILISFFSLQNSIDSWQKKIGSIFFIFKGGTYFHDTTRLGTIFILQNDIGIGSENGNPPLLYVLKMCLRKGVDWLKQNKTPLCNIKMYP